MATLKVRPPRVGRGNEIPKTVGRVDTTTAAQPDVRKVRADFRPKEFERVILQHGYFARWRKAILCPCVSPETDQAALNCATCDGSGFFYIDPIDLQVLLTNLEKSTDPYKPGGSWTTGMADATVMPQYRLGYRDSLELLDTVMVFNEWILKGNRRGPRKKLPDGVDVGRYRMVSITSVFVVDPKDGVTLVRLTHGTDYTLNSEGWIQWLTEAIPDGSHVSVHYELHPVYIVDSFPHAARDQVIQFKRAEQTVVALPVKAKVALDFAVFNKTETIALTLNSL